MRNDALATISDVELVAEKTYHNSKKLSQNDRQRRDEFVDLYGIEFARNSASKNGKHQAQFRVSVSGDAAYMERFQFKIDVEGFQSTAGSETSPASIVENPDTVSGDTLYLKDTLNPNPHKHTIVPGSATIPPPTSSWRVYCEGIDITAYLLAQCVEHQWSPGWFNGEGVFPSKELEQSFDLLEVSCDMEAEAKDLEQQGRTQEAEQKKEEASTILRQGWKPITLSADSPFYATMVLYLKYQHMNR